jgi:hypothetical protein
VQIISFVKFRAKSVMYYSQRLVSGTHISVDTGYIMPKPYPMNGTTTEDKAAVSAL